MNLKKLILLGGLAWAVYAIIKTGAQTAQQAIQNATVNK